MKHLITFNDTISSAESEKIKSEWDDLDKRDLTRIEDLDWNEHSIYTTARVNGELAGYIHVKNKAGVGVISSVLIFRKFEGAGVGKEIIKSCVEAIASHGIHKLTKTTRIIYPDFSIFIELGFKKAADLANHFGKEDYVLLSKDLTN